jgi:hypothetical protein
VGRGVIGGFEGEPHGVFVVHPWLIRSKPPGGPLAMAPRARGGICAPM